MEHFQELGDDLGKAITEGDIEKASKLINEIITLDAEFEVYLEPKKNAEILQEKKSAIQEIYEKLLEFGIEKAKAWELANSCSSVDEAINQAF